MLRNSLLSGVLLLFLVLNVYPCGVPSDITGRVFDEDGQPAANAVVMVYPVKGNISYGRTNQLGYFYIRNVGACPEYYEVLAVFPKGASYEPVRFWLDGSGYTFWFWLFPV
jgi:hypothetical protein